MRRNNYDVMTVCTCVRACVLARGIAVLCHCAQAACFLSSYTVLLIYIVRALFIILGNEMCACP